MLDLAGQSCWDRFRRTPLGKLKMRYVPSEEYRDNTYAMFMVGFGHGFVDRDALGAPCRESWFEASWRYVLAKSDGRVLLAGAPYPVTKPSDLDEAKRFFRIGYTYGLNSAPATPRSESHNCFSVAAERIG